MKEEKIEIKLSLPPSVNGLYANSKKGRTKTEEYKGFERLAFYEYKKAGKNYKISGDNWLLVKYEYFMKIYNKDGSKKIIDVFNLEKATSDVLQKLIPGFKDENIKKGFVEKHQSDRNEVKIEIREL